LPYLPKGFRGLLGLNGLFIGAKGFAVQSEQNELEPIRPRYSPAEEVELVNDITIEKMILI